MTSLPSVIVMPRFTKAAATQNGVARYFLTVAAELWRREQCSQLDQYDCIKLYISDDIKFYICRRPQEFSKVLVWGRR